MYNPSTWRQSWEDQSKFKARLSYTGIKLARTAVGPWAVKGILVPAERFETPETLRDGRRFSTSSR